MIERPILFNGEMVRAIIEGRKTQTRRVFKQATGLSLSVGIEDDSSVAELSWLHGDGPGHEVFETTMRVPCPIGQVGDRLWVRETFIQGWETNAWGDIDQYDENGSEKPIKTWYRADGHIDWEDADGEFCENTPWKPSIHMPRSASRITLEITNVRVERLQEITEDDALAEGCMQSGWMPTYSNPDNATGEETKWATDNFGELWGSIYQNWDENPWVWVIEFKRIEK